MYALKQRLRSVNQAYMLCRRKDCFVYICSMIVKKKNTYEVRSKTGKLLGKYLTKAAAERRLKQIEFFKHKNK